MNRGSTKTTTFLPVIMIEGMSKEELANLEIERAIRALKPENR